MRMAGLFERVEIRPWRVVIGALDMNPAQPARGGAALRAGRHRRSRREELSCSARASPCSSGSWCGKEGELFGYIDRCPHNGTPLAVFPDRYLTRERDLLLCGTHGALFRIGDGRCIAGPCEGRAPDAVAGGGERRGGGDGLVVHAAQRRWRRRSCWRRRTGRAGRRRRAWPAGPLRLWASHSAQVAQTRWPPRWQSVSLDALADDLVGVEAALVRRLAAVGRIVGERGAGGEAGQQGEAEDCSVSRKTPPLTA